MLVGPAHGRVVTPGRRSPSAHGAASLDALARRRRPSSCPHRRRRGRQVARDRREPVPRVRARAGCSAATSWSRSAAAWSATPRASPPRSTTAASTVVQVPTTLLAQVDAAIGGKTAVNLPEGKNLVGAFHQPIARARRHDDRSRRCPTREYRSGLGEVAKYALMPEGDACRRDLSTTHADAVVGARPRGAQPSSSPRAPRSRPHVVAADPRSAPASRATLNYGHTLAHALETAGGLRRSLHGEAVAIGLVFAGDARRARSSASAPTRSTRTAASSPRSACPTHGARRTLRGRRAARRRCGATRRPAGGLTFVLPGRRRARAGRRPAAARARRARSRPSACESLRSRWPRSCCSPGPNLNLLGEREPDDLRHRHARRHASAMRARPPRRTATTLEHLQSNHEGELIDAIQAHAAAAPRSSSTPARSRTTSYALADALATFDGVKVELHLSNPSRARGVAPHARWSRRTSTGTIAGFGARRLPPRGRGARSPSSERDMTRRSRSTPCPRWTSRARARPAARPRSPTPAIDALLVTRLPNVRYLTGFTGSAGMLLVARRRRACSSPTAATASSPASSSRPRASTPRIEIGATAGRPARRARRGARPAARGSGSRPHGVTWAQQRDVRGVRSPAPSSCPTERPRRGRCAR